MVMLGQVGDGSRRKSFFFQVFLKPTLTNGKGREGGDS
jgi:hypothetical protein